MQMPMFRIDEDLAEEGHIEQYPSVAVTDSFLRLNGRDACCDRSRRLLYLESRRCIFGGGVVE